MNRQNAKYMYCTLYMVSALHCSCMLPPLHSGDTTAVCFFCQCCQNRSLPEPLGWCVLSCTQWLLVCESALIIIAPPAARTKSQDHICALN